MSTHMYEPGSPQGPEAKSSIEISQTAKGTPTVRVKVYAGTTDDELTWIRTAAVEAYKQTCRDVGAVAA